MCDRPASRPGPDTGPGHALPQLLRYLLASNALSQGSGFPLRGLPEEFINVYPAEPSPWLVARESGRSKGSSTVIQVCT